MLKFTKVSSLLLPAVIALAAPGCGTTGWIRFETLDTGSPAALQQAAVQSVDVVDCQDYQSAEQPWLYPYFRKRVLYVTTCTKDGAGIPWKVLGVFHAGSITFDQWAKYSREVAEKARSHGCPALLIRKASPSSGQEAHAIGALCVDPTQASGVRGPMRLAAFSEEPLRILADGEPLPVTP